MHARHSHHVLVAHPRRLAAAVRRDGGGTAPRRGRDRRRQDQPRRVRDGFLHGELRVRAHAQPARHHACAGWVEWWFGGRGRGGIRTARAGVRHGWFDPPARGAVRRGGREADVRSGVAVRTHRVRVVARSDRSVRGDGRRRGASARSDRRSRPERLHVDRPARARARRRARRRRIGIADRHRRRDDGDRRDRAGRPRRGARGRGGAGSGGREGRHGVGALRDVRHRRVLPDRAGGSVVEPRALRRCAVRAPRRGRRCRAHERGDARVGFRCRR